MQRKRRVVWALAQIDWDPWAEAQTTLHEMAAGVGIAPTSAGLRPAAHLSEPSGDENEESLRVVTLRGLPVIDRLLCC